MLYILLSKVTVSVRLSWPTTQPTAQDRKFFWLSHVLNKFLRYIEIESMKII